MEHVHNEATKSVVTEYYKVMIPLFMKVNKFLNPTNRSKTMKIVNSSINYSFDVTTSTKGLMKLRLCFSCQYFIMSN
jgi:hypothetical protein